MKYILIVLLLLFSCYSPQPIQTSHTQETQDAAERAGKNLHNIPNDPETRLGPTDRAAIQDAEDQLFACRASLRSQDEKINANALKYDALVVQWEIERKGRQKCESEHGFIASILDGISTIKYVIVSFASGAIFMLLLLFVAHITGAFARIGLK